MDVWAACDRWNAARQLARDQGDNPVVAGLLERHTVWVLSVPCGDGATQTLVCETCQDSPWPCLVYTEVELMLKEVGKT